MKPAEEPAFIVLRPFDPNEAMLLKDAARGLGVSVTTMTNWAVRYGIGRRIVGGRWAISKVALAMLLDDDHAALMLYHQQQFDAPDVRAYFARTGVAFRDPPKIT